ncbi:MAG: 50S ribosomal protein L4 [Verrucomicrobia bacterium ADurb.Bin474]|nr:MAG: 50S ribosomal protein L4 [Verrucomicrobia bacterium ADurb.Bin474]
MKFKVYSPEGVEVSEKEIAEWPVLEGETGLMALRQYLLAVRNNQRQGNACTKTRSEVSGTGKKPFKQKGTGGARQGSRRTVIWRKGGVIFGPRPRDFSEKVNQKMKDLAFKRALFDRASDGKVALIQRFESADAKTKTFNSILGKMAPAGRVLIVDDQFDDKMVLAARNIERVEMIGSDTLSATDLLKFQNIIISERGTDTILARVKGAES